MLRTSIALVSMIAVVSAGAATTLPTSRPAAATRAVASRPASSKPAPRAARAISVDPVRDAVVALFREATAAAKAGQPFPRGDPDYLAGRTDIPQPRLIEELAKRQSPDARIDAYVKWQLTSAFDKFDAANAPAAIRAYALGLPALVPMTSIDHDSRGEWDRRAKQMNKQADVDAVNEAIQADFERTTQVNEVVIWCRDAIRDRIVAEGADQPKFFAAHMEDLSQRATAGINVEKDFTKLAKEIVTWAKSSEATPEQIGQVVRFAQEYVSRREPPTIYTKMNWAAKTRKATWSKREAALEPDKVTKLISDLTAVAEKKAS